MEKDSEFWNQFFGFHKAVTLFVKNMRLKKIIVLNSVGASQCK